MTGQALSLYYVRSWIADCKYSNVERDRVAGKSPRTSRIFLMILNCPIDLHVFKFFGKISSSFRHLDFLVEKY